MTGVRFAKRDLKILNRFYKHMASDRAPNVSFFFFSFLLDTNLKGDQLSLVCYVCCVFCNQEWDGAFADHANACHLFQKKLCW